MKRAIFGTRDIATYRPCFPGQLPVYTGPGRTGAPLPWYSTGKLEAAIAQGYEVIIVSIRPAFGPHDDWWRALVPSENVYVNPGIMDGFNGNPNSPRVHGAWREFYRRFGLPWSGSFNDLDDPRVAAVKNHGFTDGDSFKGNFHLN